MPQSYFEPFELEPRFALPGKQLDAAYRNLAARVHPDRCASASPAEQRRALALATDANEAYRVLKRPVLRAQHLLTLRGMDALADAAAPSPDFLIEQMQWRETLADAQQAGDAAALGQLCDRVRRHATGLLSTLERHLNGDDGDDGDLTKAAQALQQLMFTDKLLLDIDEARALLEA